MILGIINIITQILVVTFVLVGVVAVLIGIHYGAEFLFGKDSDKDTEKLREEVNKKESGISVNNIFYKFFFRNDK